MQIIEFLTDNSKQNINIILPDSKKLNLNLEYKQNLNCWFFDLNWDNNFYLYGKQLVSSMNILRQFKNIIPIGLTVSSYDGLDPCLLSDFLNNGLNISTISFQNKRITLIVLDNIDLEYLENNYVI
jgi:hypothetical protein